MSRIQEGALSAAKTPSPPAPTKLVPLEWNEQRVELFVCRRCWDEDGLTPQVGPYVCLHGEDGKEEVEAESVGWYIRLGP